MGKNNGNPDLVCEKFTFSESEDSVELLGVTKDFQLNFEEHI